jgi:hypothetical protein
MRCRRWFTGISAAGVRAADIWVASDRAARARVACALALLACAPGEARDDGAAGGGGLGGGGGESTLGAARAGAAGTGEDTVASGAALSEAEWQRLTGPQPGVHEVYDQACEGERIAQEYRIVPSVECAWRRDEGGMLAPAFILDCEVGDYCSSAADCTEQPGGVCRGNASSRCEYPGIDLSAACERDADCNAAPGGLCAGNVSGAALLCFPTGECRTSADAVCAYPSLSQPCERDADCTAAPGGACRLELSFSECAYNECDDADDCGPAARCECLGVRRCVPANCFADSDCAAGYPCAPTLALQCGNLNPTAGYYCHGASDECQSDSDCAGLSCVFDAAVERWACRDITCFDR